MTRQYKTLALLSLLVPVSCTLALLNGSSAIGIHELWSFLAGTSSPLTETIFRNIGLELKIHEKNHPGFITGRCASILIENDEIGFFGELHPKTITSFELEHPTLAIEIDIEKIKKFV